MGVLKPKSAALPEATLAQVDTRFFQSRILSNSPAQTKIHDASVALQQAQNIPANPGQANQGAKQKLPPIKNPGDALLRARAIVAGKIAFEDRASSVDEILTVLRSYSAQAATEVYGNCAIELARGLVRKEIPLQRRPQVTQFLITSLDPRSVQYVPPLLRKVARLFSYSVGAGILPREAVNASAAVILYQMNADHWTGKERSQVLESFLWGVYRENFSDLFVSSVVGRVLRVASDRAHPMAIDDVIKMVIPLSGALQIRKIPVVLTQDVLKLISYVLKTRRGSVVDRSVIALNLATYMNEDFSFTPPIEELTIVSELPGVDPKIASSLTKLIRRQPESFYKSFLR